MLWPLLLAGTIAGCSSRDAGHTATTADSTAADKSAPVANSADSAAGARQAPESAAAVVPVTGVDVTALAARAGARATLVNLWATWCAPCREEFPALLRVARAHQRDGLRLVLVSADFPEQMHAVREFLAARGMTDTSYIKSGDDMAFINALSPKLTGALPATLLYDGSGKLVTYWEGMADEARFERAVKHALTPP